jgi:hypothetical protein
LVLGMEQVQSQDCVPVKNLVLGKEQDMIEAYVLVINLILD